MKIVYKNLFLSASLVILQLYAVSLFAKGYFKSREVFVEINEEIPKTD